MRKFAQEGFILLRCLKSKNNNKTLRVVFLYGKLNRTDSHRFLGVLAELVVIFPERKGRFSKKRGNLIAKRKL